MKADWYEPVVEVTRGGVVESVHYGAVAVTDRSGRLLAWCGDPRALTFLRSSAKPFQALPFVEGGGLDSFGLSPRQLAFICASHAGTDAHKAMAESIQAQVGVREDDLLCGTHAPYDAATTARMRQNNEPLTPNRHNCSGKHSGMLAQARFLGAPLGTYIDPNHPVQGRILEAFSAMCGIPPEQVHGDLHAAQPGDADEARIVVVRDGVTREFGFRKGDASLLDAAARAGLDVPYSCKSGVCATCRAKLVEGRVRMDRNFALEKADLDAGFVLTCQSHPLSGRVVVSFDER